MEKNEPTSLKKEDRNIQSTPLHNNGFELSKCEIQLTQNMSSKIEECVTSQRLSSHYLNLQESRK